MEFLYQNVLWMMLVPIILLIFLIATNKNSMQLFFSDEIISKLAVSNSYMNKTTRNALLFISLILMTVALSRPVLESKEHNIKQKLIPIIVAIDVSKSMLAKDIFPSRLELAKKKLKQLIITSKNCAIGVVLFAKSAFILSPITEDFASLMYLVENLDSGLNFDNGSNIKAMIEASNDLLKNYSAKNIILLSDGGNSNDYSEEIALANERKIKIYAIGLATEQAAPIPTKNGYMTDSSGKIVSVPLNKEVVTLAKESGGGYIDFTLGHDDIKAILTQITTESKRAELDSHKVKTYTELFYYPLGLAIFILLFAFSSLPKRKLKTMLLILLITYNLQPTSLKAGLFDFKTLDEAKNAYENSDFKTASRKYKEVAKNSEGYYNLANSLYKSGKYKEALKNYQKVVTDNKELEYRKLHNIGNSYVKLNDLQNAKKMYEKALKIKDEKQTRENLEAVKKALRKNSAKHEKQDKKSKKQNKKNKDNKNKKDNKEKEDKNKDKQDSKQETRNKKHGTEDENKKNNNKKKKKQNENKKNDKNKDIQDKNKGKQGEMQQQKIDKNHKIPQKQELISDLEEKKWLKSLQNRKIPILLHKAKTTDETNDDNIKNPW